MKFSIPKSYYVLSIYVLLIAAVIIFGIIPKINELKSNRIALEQNNAKLAKDEEAISNLSKYSKNKTDLDSVEKTVKNLLPDTQNSSDFVVQMEALGTDLSIVFPTLTITEPVAKKATPVQEDEKTTSANKTSSESTSSTPSAATSTAKNSGTGIPFSTSFKTTYPGFKTFLQKIASFPRFTSLSSVNISGYSVDAGTLQFDLKGNIYYGK
ncbi:MAG: hypothetical protein WC080_04490 [Patescibacteria group bacterium]|jgi:Tfp pilus assembly protein PilO